MDITYLDEIKSQNKRLTAKFMTLIENNNTNAIDQLKTFYLHEKSNKTHIIGITGFPGAGKSSLINSLIKFYRQKGLRIGVIAIDPTSPFTGGALLGDRVRMDEFSLDKDVFIRSMASKGSLGGVAPSTSAFIKILEEYGCDIIIVETVGIGQSETDIVGMADTVLLVTIPSAGDHIQALKAGVFEIADIFIVNKSDLAGADKQELFIKQMLTLNSTSNVNWFPPIIKTSTINNDLQANGILEVISSIEKHWNYLQKSAKLIEKRKKRIKTEILSILQFYVSQELLTDQNGIFINNAIEKILKNELDPYSVVKSFVDDFNR